MVIPVRWGDLDAMGHVNNTTYFRYFETLRIDWLGPLMSPPDPTGIGPVMANGFCNFRKQIEFPCDLLAVHFVGAVGRSSLETFFTLADSKAPDVVLAEGGATLVWVDFPKGQSVAVPEQVRAACERGRPLSHVNAGQG